MGPGSRPAGPASSGEPGKGGKQQVACGLWLAYWQQPCPQGRSLHEPLILVRRVGLVREIGKAAGNLWLVACGSQPATCRNPSHAVPASHLPLPTPYFLDPVHHEPRTTYYVPSFSVIPDEPAQPVRSGILALLRVANERTRRRHLPYFEPPTIGRSRAVIPSPLVSSASTKEERRRETSWNVLPPSCRRFLETRARGPSADRPLAWMRPGANELIRHPLGC